MITGSLALMTESETPETTNPPLEQRPLPQLSVEERHSIKYQAPLPPPAMLEHYERVLPGSADRILRMAEQQSAHRQDLEARKLRSDIRNESMGQILAFTLALVGLLGGLFLAYEGKSLAGLTTFITTLVSLLGLFIYGRKSQEKERAERLDKLLKALPQREQANDRRPG